PNAADLDRRKQVRLRLRPDLKIVPQKYEGRTYHVVKDPVNLRYYRLDAKHSFIVELLDGSHTLEEIQKEFEKQFRPERLTLEQLEAFAQQLARSGLAHNDSPQAGKQLFEHRSKRRRQEWLQMLTNILYIKIPVFDPDRLLARMVPYFGWIFTGWFMLLSAGVMLLAVLLVTTHFEVFRARLPSYQEFFSVKTFFQLWMALGAVKIIHEFGHGLSCKTFGGEVHEMGLLFLCLAPCLYCNVSDAWTMPSKWRRIIISFAGIYVELMIAAIATFVWWNTPASPFINNLALCLMIVCSVSTVIFNGNPLMKYDGYYVFFDWLEVPNLRDRANQFIKYLVMEHCLGMETPWQPYMALSRRILFVTYAVTSYIYRWVVTCFILYFLYHLLAPRKLAALGALLVVAALASLLGWPLFRLGQALHKRGRLPDMNGRRVGTTAAVIAAFVLFIFLVPLPLSRVRQIGLVQVQPEAEANVYVSEPGVLQALYVRDGQRVEENDLLAEFRSLELENELAEAHGEYEVRVVQVQALQEQEAATGDAEERAKIEAGLTRMVSERAEYARLIQMYEARRRRLQVRAPRAGIVLAPPRLDEVGKLWDKDQATPFCIVADPSQLRVLVPVPPADYRLLQEDLNHEPDLPSTIRVQGRVGHPWDGHVVHLDEQEAKAVPLALTSKGGGPLAVKPSSNPDMLQPQTQQYLVVVNFDQTDGALCPGTLAQVKVKCRWRTTAWWLWRRVSATFDLGLM
ncbi:MAG TPA: site-2 protease family protein, partial [Gemmataceae bacterium]|nr:site-2 protease family protein [Gemmataceae bacterium]